MNESDERLSHVLARASTPPDDASRPADADVEQWIQDAESAEQLERFNERLDKQDKEIDRLRGWLMCIETVDACYATELAGYALRGEVVPK